MASCCPHILSGFCLIDGTPIAIVVSSTGVQEAWINLLTGVRTPGAPPAGTEQCEQAIDVTVDFIPLTCATDSVTICPGDDPIIVVIEGIDPVSGSIPVTFDGTIAVSLDCATDSVTICPGDDPIIVDQGTTPWIVELDGGSVSVSGIVDTRFLDCLTDSIEVCQGASPWIIDGTATVDGTVELGAATLSALETITVLQGTNPWIVDANINFEYPEDTPHTTGDTGAFVLAVRNDAGTPLAGDGDYIPFTTDATGALRVTGGGGVFQHEEILCDDDVTFVRKYIQDIDGNVISVVDFDLDGVPYVVTGTVQVCGGDAPITPQTLDSTADRLTGAGTISISSGSKSVSVIVLSGSPTVEIDADPAITLVPGMALTWGVDAGNESLLNAFTFTGFLGSDIFVHTTSGPLAATVLDSTVERLTGAGSVIIAAGANSITITVISGLPTVTIGGGPAIPFVAGMSMSWSVDEDQEDLADVFTFTGVSGSDFVVTSTRV